VFDNSIMILLAKYLALLTDVEWIVELIGPFVFFCFDIRRDNFLTFLHCIDHANDAELSLPKVPSGPGESSLRTCLGWTRMVSRWSRVGRRRSRCSAHSAVSWLRGVSPPYSAGRREGASSPSFSRSFVTLPNRQKRLQRAASLLQSVSREYWDYSIFHEMNVANFTIPVRYVFNLMAHLYIYAKNMSVYYIIAVQDLNLSITHKYSFPCGSDHITVIDIDFGSTFQFYRFNVILV
jgi:hypothetical protein